MTSATVDLPGFLYNIGASRDQDQVAAEIRAMLDHREHRSHPATAEVRLTEAIGYRLPKVKGYTLFRDRTSAARANIATYLRNDLASSHRWIDLSSTWPKTDHPGIHPPRSFQVTRVGRCIGVTAHQGPPFTRQAHPEVQAEGQGALIETLAPEVARLSPVARERANLRPRWVAYDANARAGDPHPSPTTLAAAIGGRVAGKRIDCLVYRGCVVAEHEYVERVGGVRLGSDHHRAFRYVITVDAKWIP